MNIIQKKLIDIKQNTEQFEMIGNISFCMYYAIMVIIKTFGYVSYETFFKIAFVMAVVCLAVRYAGSGSEKRMSYLSPCLCGE